MSENFTLALLRRIDGKVDGLAGEVADMRKGMATKNDIADVRSEIHSLRADVASDLMDLETRLNERFKDQEKWLGDQISGLRRSVMEHRSSQIGRGVLITEFEERLRRLAQHVGITPRGALAIKKFHGSIAAAGALAACARLISSCIIQRAVSKFRYCLCGTRGSPCGLN